VRDLCGYHRQTGRKWDSTRIESPLILLWVTGLGCSHWMNFGSFKPLVVGSTPTAPTNYLICLQYITETLREL